MDQSSFPTFDASSRAWLKRLAVDAISAAASGSALSEPLSEPECVLAHRAAFVSVYVAGRLRGCMGLVIPDRPLAHVVCDMAAAAATRDGRFPAVKASDLPLLSVEISVLGERVPVSTPEEIVIGRDGLLVEKGEALGLLLPQVGSRYGWTREEFLRQTAEKAGLDPESWREARVYRFQAEVF